MIEFRNSMRGLSIHLARQFSAQPGWIRGHFPFLTLHSNAMYIAAIMKLEKELVAASSVPLVLSILSEGESYGYAIIQRVKELSGGRIEWTDGMLYPVLHWIEEQGLVRCRWTKSESGRKRKYYFLQPEGRKMLKEQKEQWKVVNSTLNQLWRPQHA